LNMPSATEIIPGSGGMPKVCLSSADGARAEVYLHGAHVTSWIPAGGDERLFLSQKSEFGSAAAIRGGVPVIFPQFGSLGTLPKHGLVRTLPWELISLGGDSHSATVELNLTDGETTRKLWPHPFQSKMKVTVGGKQLELTFTVTNVGDDPISFTAALHTYLRVENIHTTRIDGLHGLRFHDTVNRPTPADWVEKIQTDKSLSFTGEIDRVYYNVPHPLKVCEPGRIMSITAAGFPDVVIWNPGPEKSARLADMEPDGYLRMVRVEAAIAGAPVTLTPGDTWRGAQILIAA
jgi:glucose-6-phosphate 1-epimerase